MAASHVLYTKEEQGPVVHFYVHKVCRMLKFT
jgi:hypothetical protein